MCGAPECLRPPGDRDSILFCVWTSESLLPPSRIVSPGSLSLSLYALSLPGCTWRVEGRTGQGLLPVSDSTVTGHTCHPQLREHLAKGQRMLAGEGMSQVVRSLQELLARRTYYSGDLLFSVDILRNVTDTFKRATYVPSADDVQVLLHSAGVCWGSVVARTS